MHALDRSARSGPLRVGFDKLRHTEYEAPKSSDHCYPLAAEPAGARTYSSVRPTIKLTRSPTGTIGSNQEPFRRMYSHQSDQMALDALMATSNHGPTLAKWQ